MEWNKVKLEILSKILKLKPTEVLLKWDHDIEKPADFEKSVDFGKPVDFVETVDFGKTSVCLQSQDTIGLDCNILCRTFSRMTLVCGYIFPR